MAITSRITPLILVAATGLTTVSLAACGGGSKTSSKSPTTPVNAAATVDVGTKSSLGNILVDSDGRTLYIFKKDSGTKSTCFGSCATNWPPLRASQKPSAGNGV